MKFQNCAKNICELTRILIFLALQVFFWYNTSHVFKRYFSTLIYRAKVKKYRGDGYGRFTIN